MKYRSGNEIVVRVPDFKEFLFLQFTDILNIIQFIQYDITKHNKI